MSSPGRHTAAHRRAPDGVLRTPVRRVGEPTPAVALAGLGMADGLLKLVPGATVGHIGCYRDEKTKQPVEYLAEIPQHMGKTFIVVDPMIATGNSAKFAVHLLKNRGVLGEDIKFMALLAAPEGVQVFQDAHPDVHLLAASLDSNLDKNAFILPGLGDAGDRLFGTTK